MMVFFLKYLVTVEVKHCFIREKVTIDCIAHVNEVISLGRKLDG